MTVSRDARIALQERVAALEHELGGLRAEAEEKTEELAQRRRDLTNRSPARPANRAAIAGIVIAIGATAAGIAYVGMRRTPEPPMPACPPVTAVEKAEVQPLDVQLDALLASTSPAENGSVCRISVVGRRSGGHNVVEDVALVCEGGRTLYHTSADPDPKAAERKLKVIRDQIEGSRVLYGEDWVGAEGENGSAAIDTDRGEARFRIAKRGEEERTWTAKILPAGGAR